LSEPLLVEVAVEPVVEVDGLDTLELDPDSLDEESLDEELDSLEPPPSFELDSLGPLPSCELDSFEPPSLDEPDSPFFEAEPDELGLDPLDDDARESVLYQPLPLNTMPTG
jgi:hypothetical protein